MPYAAILGWALVPYFFFSQAAITAIIVLYVLLYRFNYIGVPGWLAIVGAEVPDGVRGRFFSLRATIQSLLALVVVPLAGRIILWAGFPGGYQICFVLCVLFGLSALFVYRRIPEPPRARQPRTQWALLR